MTDVFTDYEQEFNELKASLKQRIAAVSTVKGEEREKEMRGADVDIATARELIEKMEVGSADNPRLEAKVEGFKRELKSISSLYKKAVAKSSYEVERESLIGGVAMRDLDVTSSDHRQRAVDATQRLAQSGNQIKESVRMAEDTATVVEGSLGELGRQRNVIEHSTGRIGDINESLGHARRLMRSISRRLMTNKAIAIGVILFLLTGMALVVYFRWFRNTGGSTPTPTSNA